MTEEGRVKRKVDGELEEISRVARKVNGELDTDASIYKKVDGELVDLVQPAIPDSVASRPADDASTTESAKEGLGIETKSDWPSIGARISNNTSGLTTAYLEDTDRNVIETVDVSGLSSGDAFTFDNVNLQENNEYLILGDAEGGDYTLGYVNETNYPYTSTDVDIIGTLANDSLPLETDNQPRVFNDIGNTGFD